jgi:hypothetical protein
MRGEERVKSSKKEMGIRTVEHMLISGRTRRRPDEIETVRTLLRLSVRPTCEMFLRCHLRLSSKHRSVYTNVAQTNTQTLCHFIIFNEPLKYMDRVHINA